MVHLWEHCLPGKEHYIFCSQQTSWPGLLGNEYRKEEINTSSLETDQKQEMFDFTFSPFSIKEAWILIQARWFFGTQICLLSESSHYSLPQQLISRFTGRLCALQNSLDLITGSEVAKTFISFLLLWSLGITHCILFEMKVLVAQLCLTLYDPMDCSLPGSSAHGILQARILEWVAIPFSRASSQPRDQTLGSCIAGRFFTIWVTREAQFFCLMLR